MKLAPPVRKPVFLSPGPLLIHPFFQYRVRDQLGQPIAEHMACYTQPALKGLEAAHPEKGVP